MKTRSLITIILLVIGAALVISSTLDATNLTTEVKANLISEAADPTGFAKADGSYSWNFPQDFGPHPEYQTEWWYYTGNLETEDGRQFGYQLTFFRRALTPLEETTPRPSSWGTNQVYMAHFALSDIDANQHHGFEQFARGAADLAGAQSEPFRVWLGSWEVFELASGDSLLEVQQSDFHLRVKLSRLKNPVFQGIEGYSQKGPEPGNASYYYSQTRLATSGTVQTPDGVFQVEGMSWMDHEFSTSALSEGQVGWDWFSIQLDNGTDLMVFQLRREDGSIDPFSSGTLVSPNGENTTLSKEDFTIQPLDTWQSPETQAEYPSRWRIELRELNLTLEVTPLMPDQEMNLSYAYWEGAVEISGQLEDQQVYGFGYVELTGYASSMEGQF
jgi:predicted secreted hydrolase